ncbi:bifunctional RNase H/acid phosphatase [Jatrophihabitans telluris]|uniref:Bifunctional RNase H/acid phosphatase n=1 Tax=Jatrophihabitans telluris TaxID=2038343 RepID=A0ABY4QVG1_9ACTN|nr:bifunctional RNase H/acid phosphatase [Jatrophihabitans telluris]UQX87298.1 bifunctional RNase H/acid phosphatase [Jatrophihabitans telluris]
MNSVASVVVEADGGSRGNPGPAGYGAVVRDEAGTVLAEVREFLGVTTNNVAEYRGLIAGLSAAQELGARRVTVRMDSKLVIEQVSGRWQVNDDGLRPLHARARALVDSFEAVSLSWIPRAENAEADRLANEAMDSAADGRGTPELAGKPDREPRPQNAWLPPGDTPTRLILLRHGITEHTLAKRFAGRSDLPLTDEGRGQAERAAQRIAQLGPVDVVVSSPLRRARTTAQIVAETLDLSPVTVVDDVVETDFGQWDGFTFAEVGERWPEQLQAWMADPAVAPPGGESFEAVDRRVSAASARLVAQHPGATVVVVSHVTPIKLLVRNALRAPMSSLYRMFLDPASISVLDYFADGLITLRSFNDSAHLAG